MSTLRQVGHWRVPASFSQSARKHLALATESEFIVKDNQRTRELVSIFFQRLVFARLLITAVDRVMRGAREGICSASFDF
jgi:hypothetical protein